MWGRRVPVGSFSGQWKRAGRDDLHGNTLSEELDFARNRNGSA
jgi:hypothetical protein